MAFLPVVSDIQNLSCPGESVKSDPKCALVYKVNQTVAKNSISLEIAAFVSVTACYIIVQNITDSLKIERSQVKKVITSFLDSITPVEDTNDENTEDKGKQS